MTSARVERTDRRRAVRIRFALSRATDVRVLFRGPHPDCGTAERVTLRGRRGANTLRFDGRVRGRRLEPGEYLIGLHVRASGPSRVVGVRVGPTDVSPLSKREVALMRAACRRAVPAAAVVPLRREQVLAAAGAQPTPPQPPSESRPSTPPTPPLVTPEPGPELPSVLSFDDVVTADEIPAAVGIVAGLLLIASLAAAAFFVVRFLRSN